MSVAHKYSCLSCNLNSRFTIVLIVKLLLSCYEFTFTAFQSLDIVPVGHCICDFFLLSCTRFMNYFIFFYVLQPLTSSIFHRAVNIKAEDTCLVRQLTVFFKYSVASEQLFSW